MTFQPFYVRDIIPYPDVSCKQCPNHEMYRNKRLVKRITEIQGLHYVVKAKKKTTKVPTKIIAKILSKAIRIEKTLETYTRDLPNYVWCSRLKRNVPTDFAFVCDYYWNYVRPKVIAELESRRSM